MIVDNETETKIIERLDRLVGGMDKLVEAIPKPASRTRITIEWFVTIATIAGILSAIDIIIDWIGGK